FAKLLRLALGVRFQSEQYVGFCKIRCDRGRNPEVFDRAFEALAADRVGIDSQNLAFSRSGIRLTFAQTAIATEACGRTFGVERLRDCNFASGAALTHFGSGKQ